ncbi:hypothetical protein B9G55_23570 [Saccharibacillus sp. O16]|nr:hypothetical protein B9G55_23570 [Saccharibacillus sp. O16]
MNKKRWMRGGGAGALTLALLTVGAGYAAQPAGAASLQPTAEPTVVQAAAQDSTPVKKPDSSSQAAAEKKQILRQANLALRALADRDFAALADQVGAEGLRFSAYAYVVPESDRVLTADELRGAWADRKPYVWGSYDGSGRPIRLDFRGYYTKFLYNLPYTAPDGVGYNRTIGGGNMPNNLNEVYPDAVFVEFYVKGGRSGVPNVGGMDWGSLRFVFQPVEGKWTLVGIVGDRWTI